MKTDNLILKSNSPIDLTEITILGSCFLKIPDSKEIKEIKNLDEAKVLADKIIESSVYNKSYKKIVNNPNLPAEMRQEVDVFVAYSKVLCKKIKSYTKVFFEQSEEELEKGEERINALQDEGFWINLFITSTVEALDKINIIFDDDDNEVVIEILKGKDVWRYVYINIPETKEDLIECQHLSFNGFSPKKGEHENMLTFMEMIATHILLHAYRTKQYESGVIGEDFFKSVFDEMNNPLVSTPSTKIQ